MHACTKNLTTHLDFEVEPKHSSLMQVFLPIGTAKNAEFNAIWEKDEKDGKSNWTAKASCS